MDKYANLNSVTYSETTELENYTWYNDNNNANKIGISSNCETLWHDNIIYTLKKFKKIEETVNDINIFSLVYKFDVRVGDSKQLQQYFTDGLFGERSNYVTLKYKNSKFSHIVFNGKEFK